jgi:hypothetical protein
MKQVTRIEFDRFINRVQKKELVTIDELSASLFLYKLTNGHIIGIDSPHKFEVDKTTWEQYTTRK